MNNVMRIIMVVMTGNCMMAIPPDAILRKVSADRAASVVYPIVRPISRPVVIGSVRWMAVRMLAHAQVQFGQ